MRAIRLSDLVIVAWLAAMIGLPLSYYVGGHVEDERFSWRMFSTVRLTKCEVALAERSGDRWRDVPLQREVHMAWVTQLQRGQPRVVGRLFERRCEGDRAPEAVRLTRTCRLPGRPLPLERVTVQACGGRS